MLMEKMKSSNIESAGWENGSLQVRFKNGGTYVYGGVPEEVWTKFQKAESAGAFLAKVIIPGYRASKVGAA